MGDERRHRSLEHKRAKSKGRKTEHSWLALPHYMLESPEFCEIPVSAVKLLVQVAGDYRGENNGNLEIVWEKKYKGRGWNSETTLTRARDELINRGWLVCTRHPYKRRCALYAITWQPIDECEGKNLEIAPQRVASNAWRKQKQTPRIWSDKPQNLEKPEKSDPNKPRNVGFND